MAEKLCPFLSANERQACLGDVCMMYLDGGSPHACALVRLGEKHVVRLDTISAQLQELQVLVNQLAEE